MEKEYVKTKEVDLNSDVRLHIVFKEFMWCFINLCELLNNNKS